LRHAKGQSRRTTRRAAGLLAAAVLTVPIAAGCSESGDRTTTAKITRSAFIKRANIICNRTYQQIRAEYLAFVKSSKANGFSEIQPIRRYANTVLIPAKQREVKELRALGAPSGDEGQVEAIIDAYEEGIATAKEDARAAVTSAFGVFVKATEMAEEYGLQGCRY
jgi:hypothetical protein